MRNEDFDEDPFLSPSPNTLPQESDTPTRPYRWRSNSGYSLPALPPATSNSASAPTTAIEDSPLSRMTPLPTSGLGQWKAQMEGRPISLPMLPFMIRGFRNPDAVPAFHRFETTISSKLSFDIRFLCDNYNHSGMNFGLAALQILLSQLTGTDDFVIGLGRALKGKGDTRPVRFKGDLYHTSNQLLEQTKASMDLSKRYLHEPVKDLLSELNISKQAILHQVTFDWCANAYPTSPTTDKYFVHAQDLVLVVREDRDRNLVLCVGLDSKTYDKEHAQTVANMYIRAMRRVVAQSKTSVADMDLVPPAERAQSLARGTGSTLEVPSNSVLERLQQIATATPNQVAVKDEEGVTMTYIELTRRAIAMASDLKKHGVVRGTPVCIIGPPTIDTLCGIFAIWCAGGIYVPLDHHLPVDDNLPIAKNADTEFCVVSMPSLVDYALSLQLGTVFWCGDMIHIEGFDDVEEPLSDDVAMGLHVPSLNGIPKGVILTHNNLESLIAFTAFYFEDQQPTVLQHSNWTSEFSLFQILFALTSGGTLFLAADPSPVDVGKIMLNQKITVTIATPSEYSLWFQQPLNMLSSCESWKFAVSGGENLPSSVIRSFNELRNNQLELANFYGATETSVACCMGFVDFKAYATNKEGQLLPVGNALPNYQVWVGVSKSAASQPQSPRLHASDTRCDLGPAATHTWGKD